MKCKVVRQSPAVVSAELAPPTSVTISAAVACPVRRLAARVLWPDWPPWARIERIPACEGPRRRHERAGWISCGALDRVYLALHDADVGTGPRWPYQVTSAVFHTVSGSVNRWLSLACMFSVS